MLLTSFSKIKKNAVSSVFGVSVKSINSRTLMDQPIGIEQTITCAEYRLKNALTVIETEKNKIDWVISIESGLTINKTEGTVSDFVVAILYSRKLNRKFIKSGGTLTSKAWPGMIEQINNQTTYGSLVHAKFPDIPADNWMVDVSREDQIKSVLNYHLDRKNLIDNLITYPDFPRKGILFRDVINLMNTHSNIRIIKNHIDSYLTTQPHIDYVVGLDARGFILGAIMADHLKIGFVPIRKSGKLPGECFKCGYTKEYGSDCFEMQKSAFSATGTKEINVLIIDDILATGGTLLAALELLKNFNVNKKIIICLDKVDAISPDLTQTSDDVSQYILLADN